MRSTHLSFIAQVRFLVGALGERRGWWRSRFTDEASRRSLELLFPRRPVHAALESVVEAARRVHDEPPLDQRASAFHLFRLPLHLEDRLAGWTARAGTTLTWPPTTEEALFSALGRLAGKSAGSMAVGPICLGKPERLNQESTFREMAAVYHVAARGDARVIPYFEE
ncbi:MAG: BrxE family protein [Polyangiaceae bacterium]